eukprot:CAMPEP_0205854904 /NCGR_PEP_ID=MMETSP1083-20121108/2325_1 /ASSEMBLY_ACC=CAM_ASM_000430 /TAXON_ID=97485 /ORGANISM="Prymnesium parvum, Strain Texoma1" /LENGTH=96 /DNA_ID=CAMNT_0053216253 /DNA_START=331 /DNA_END=622 /DNA_ORIENTATION=+
MCSNEREEGGAAVQPRLDHFVRHFEVLIAQSQKDELRLRLRRLMPKARSIFQEVVRKDARGQPLHLTQRAKSAIDAKDNDLAGGRMCVEHRPPPAT